MTTEATPANVGSMKGLGVTDGGTDMSWLDRFKPHKGDVYKPGQCLPEPEHETATGRKLYTVQQIRAAYAQGARESRSLLGTPMSYGVAFGSSDAQDIPWAGGVVKYPKGEVIAACICGSWPGGECLRCPLIAA